eukprot:11381501-Alexandrium_andersonii.AAC.1
MRVVARDITHRVSWKTKIRGACNALIRASYRHLTKWIGVFCKNDPSRSVETSLREILDEDDIRVRAAKGEAPGGGAGRFVLAADSWEPASRLDFPPEDLFDDSNTG